MYQPKFELLSFSSLPMQHKQIVLRAALEFLIVAAQAQNGEAK